MAREHELKCLPGFFREVWTEKKKFEIRKDDRGYRSGDRVLLREFDGEQYTGREVMADILYILRGCPEYGLAEDYCILSLGNIVRGIKA